MPAADNIKLMDDAFLNLPIKEQEEIKYVRERLSFLIAKFGSSAELAITYTSLKIAQKEGQ